MPTSQLSEFSSVTWSQPTEPVDKVRCVNSCDAEHKQISSIIITVGLIAMIENILLMAVVAKMRLGTGSKMLAFLWHFSLGDAIIAFSFVFYHARTMACCPRLFTCDPQYVTEIYFVQTIFTTSLLASYFFILAATVDTLIAVCWSLRYAKLVTTWRVRVVAGILWLTTIIVSLTGVVIMIKWDKIQGHSVLTFIVAILCTLTAAAVIVINIVIIVAAWININRGVNNEAERRQTHFRVQCLNTISRSLSSRSRISAISFQLSERQKRNRKLAITLIMFVFAFLISCVPWPVTLLICHEVTTCAIKSSNVYILVLVLIHTVVVPIIYGFRINEIKQRIRKIFRAIIKSDIN